MSFTGSKWFRCTLLISIASALVSASNVPEALVDDECEGECSLEMLHLRAKKIVQAEVSEGNSNNELSAESDGNVENENEENKGHCTTWVNCKGGFWHGHRCSGGRYCSRWGGGGGGRVCRKYVSCRNGFFNGINCHGSRYCVTWGLLQEGEEESGKDSETQTEEVAETQNEESDSSISAESDGNVENEKEENKGHCTTWVRCKGGFWRGHRCSGGRYCSRWGGGGGGRRRWGGGGGGRVCRKYVSCRNGFFNGIRCNGSRHCVSWR